MKEFWAILFGCALSGFLERWIGPFADLFLEKRKIDFSERSAAVKEKLSDREKENLIFETQQKTITRIKKLTQEWGESLKHDTNGECKSAAELAVKYAEQHFKEIE